VRFLLGKELLQLDITRSRLHLWSIQRPRIFFELECHSQCEAAFCLAISALRGLDDDAADRPVIPAIQRDRRCARRSGGAAQRFATPHSPLLDTARCRVAAMQRNAAQHHRAGLSVARRAVGVSETWPSRD
jgi:hypothetical protein